MKHKIDGVTYKSMNALNPYNVCDGCVAHDKDTLCSNLYGATMCPGVIWRKHEKKPKAKSKKIIVDGVTYKSKDSLRCEGCAAEFDEDLCDAIYLANGCHDIVWRKHEKKDKSTNNDLSLVWVNVGPVGEPCYVYNTKEEADSQDFRRVACFAITRR